MPWIRVVPSALRKLPWWMSMPESMMPTTTPVPRCGVDAECSWSTLISGTLWLSSGSNGREASTNWMCGIDSSSPSRSRGIGPAAIE